MKRNSAAKPSPEVQNLLRQIPFRLACEVFATVLAGNPSGQAIALARRAAAPKSGICK